MLFSLSIVSVSLVVLVRHYRPPQALFGTFGYFSFGIDTVYAAGVVACDGHSGTLSARAPVQRSKIWSILAFQPDCRGVVCAAGAVRAVPLTVLNPARAWHAVPLQSPLLWARVRQRQTASMLPWSITCGYTQSFDWNWSRTKLWLILETHNCAPSGYASKQSDSQHD